MEEKLESPAHYRAKQADFLARTPGSKGQSDRLVEDVGDLRVWVSRMTLDDGAPENEQVTVERKVEGSWHIVCHSRGNRWVKGQV